MANKRIFLKAAASTFFGFLSSAHANNASPKNSIKIIVPFSAGGLLDTLGRAYGKYLGEGLNKAVIVENRVGGAGTIGVNQVAKALPDGTTLLIGSVVTHAINPHLLKSSPYDAARDFIPVAMLGLNGNALLVSSSFPANSFQEFVSHVRSKKGAINYASASIGSSAHLAAELLQVDIPGLECSHVPYNGPSEAMAALIGGHVDFMFANIGPSLAQVASGKLKALAVTTSERVPQLPNVPTIAESGVPGFEVVGWIAAFVPKGTPAIMVSKLNETLNRANTSSNLKQVFQSASIIAMNYSPEESASYIGKEYKKWNDVIVRAKIQRI